MVTKMQIPWKSPLPSHKNPDYQSSIASFSVLGLLRLRSSTGKNLRKMSEI